MPVIGATGERTPLLSNHQLNDWKHDTVDNDNTNQDLENTLENLNTTNEFYVFNTSSNANDQLNNNLEARVQQQGGVYVYLKRWYILAVFSVLGILQVNEMLSLRILRNILYTAINLIILLKFYL